MAPYEHVETSATVEVDTDELDQAHLVAIEYANNLLDEALQEDIDRADETSATPEENTYLHAWKDALL